VGDAVFNGDEHVGGLRQCDIRSSAAVSARDRTADFLDLDSYRNVPAGWDGTSVRVLGPASPDQLAKLQCKYYAFGGSTTADAAALCLHDFSPVLQKLLLHLFFAADFSAKYMNIFEHFCACSCNVFSRNTPLWCATVDGGACNVRVPNANGPSRRLIRCPVDHLGFAPIVLAANRRSKGGRGSWVRRCESAATVSRRKLS
jgi:hypothetical protein